MLLRISREAYSSMIDVLANRKACFTGLLNAAAVPTGDLGSAPPSENKMKHRVLTFIFKYINIASILNFNFYSTQNYLQRNATNPH